MAESHPCDLQIEKAVLSSILVEPNCFDSANIKEDFFFDAKHRAIFLAMKALRRSRRDIDILTVTAELASEKKLAGIGGQEALMLLQSELPPKGDAFESWVDLLDSLALRRRACRSLSELLALAKTPGPDVSDLKAKASRALGEISGGGSRKIQSTKEKLLELGETMAKPVGAKSERIPYCVGFADDAMTHYRGQIHSLGALQGVGKTAFALTIANAQIDTGLKVRYACTESKGIELLARMLAQRCGLAANRLLEGCGDDKQALMAAIREHGAMAGRVESFGIYGLGEFEKSIEGVAGVARRFAFDAGGIDMLFVDFLQELKSDTDAKGRRLAGEDGIYDRVSHSMEGVKDLTEELNCATMLLSQFNRDSCKQAKPTKASFRGSGVIDDLSHIMSVIYREGDDSKLLAEGVTVWPTWWKSVKTRLIKPFSRQIGFKSDSQKYVQTHRFGKEDLPAREDDRYGKDN